MQRSKFLLIIVSIFFLIYFCGETVFSFSTHPGSTNISRTFDKILSTLDESIRITVSFQNTGAIVMRGFYYVDHIPQGLTVNTISMKVNGNNVPNYIEEFGSVDDVYNGTIPYRWILETPSGFNENNPIGSGSVIEIIYSVSSSQLGKFNFDEFNWVGYYQEASEDQRAAFGYSENTNKQTVIFAPRPPSNLHILNIEH